MSDISQVITQIIDTTFIPAVIIALAVLIIGYLNRYKIHLGWLNIKTRFCLGNLGQEQLSGILCPDGMDSEFTIDRLLLRHDGITLLITKQYPGRIFCADHIDDWTQMLAGKSYRFQNPLFELDYQVKSVADCIPGVAVDGFLFFDYQSEFPKGHPQRVIHPGHIPESLVKNNQLQVEAPVIQAWEKLKSMASR